MLVGWGAVSVSVDDDGSGMGCESRTSGFGFLVELLFLVELFLDFFGGGRGSLFSVSAVGLVAAGGAGM